MNNWSAYGAFQSMRTANASRDTSEALLSLRQDLAERERYVQSLPQCPWCGNRLEGRFEICNGCSRSIIWRGEFIGKPGEEQQLNKCWVQKSENARKSERLSRIADRKHYFKGQQEAVDQDIYAKKASMGCATFFLLPLAIILFVCSSVVKNIRSPINFTHDGRAVSFVLAVAVVVCWLWCVFYNWGELNKLNKKVTKTAERFPSQKTATSTEPHKLNIAPLRTR